MPLLNNQMPEPIQAPDKILDQYKMEDPNPAPIRKVPYNSSVVRKAHWSKRELRELADKVAEQEGVPKALLSALVQQESSWVPNAASGKGAVGLTQLTPITVKDLKQRGSLKEFGGDIDREDPFQNLVAGARYLKYLHKRFKGDIGLTLAAYNAGPTIVGKLGRVPDYEETQNYVRKITKNYYSQLDSQESSPRPIL